MLCQNCRSKDASVHMKRIIGGEADEIHLCAGCASALGYSDILPGFGISFSQNGGFFGFSDLKSSSNRILRCEVCGFSFDDITKTGKTGCPNCYRVFYDKLFPSLRKTPFALLCLNILGFKINNELKTNRITGFFCSIKALVGIVNQSIIRNTIAC